MPKKLREEINCLKGGICESCYQHEKEQAQKTPQPPKESWEVGIRDIFRTMINFGVEDGDWKEDMRTPMMFVCKDVIKAISTLKQEWEQEAYEKGKKDARKSAEDLAPEFGHEMEQQGIAKGYKQGCREERARLRKEWERVASEEEMMDWKNFLRD